MNRTELQTQLKTFRAEGYGLKVKLTAPTTDLATELERLLSLAPHLEEHVTTVYETAPAEECTAIVPYQAEPCQDTAVKAAARFTARAVHAVRTHDYARDLAIFNMVAMTAFLWGAEFRSWVRAHQSEIKSALKIANRVGEEVFVAVGMAAIATYCLGRRARIEFDRWFPYVDSFRHYVIWLPMTRAIGNEDTVAYIWRK